MPWRRKWQPTPALLPAEPHGWRSLVQATVHRVAKSQTRLSTKKKKIAVSCFFFSFSFYFPECMVLGREVKVSCSVMSNSFQPHGLQQARLLCPWNFPDKNIREGIFPTQGSNPNSSHLRGCGNFPKPRAEFAAKKYKSL